MQKGWRRYLVHFFVSFYCLVVQLLVSWYSLWLLPKLGTVALLFCYRDTFCIWNAKYHMPCVNTEPWLYLTYDLRVLFIFACVLVVSSKTCHINQFLMTMLLLMIMMAMILLKHDDKIVQKIKLACSHSQRWIYGDTCPSKTHPQNLFANFSS